MFNLTDTGKITAFLTSDSTILCEGVIITSKQLSNDFVMVTLRGTWSEEKRTTIYPTPGSNIAWPLSRLMSSCQFHLKEIIKEKPTNWEVNPLSTSL